jgi:hypothetical protein
MPTEPLRPMRLGQILDRTFSLYRSHFALLVGIAAFPAAWSLAVNLLLQAVQPAPPGAQAAPDPAAAQRLVAEYAALLPIFALLAIVSGLVYLVASGTTAVAAARLYLGRATTMGGSYRAVRARLRSLLGMAILILFRVLGYLALAGVATAIVAGVVTVVAPPLRPFIALLPVALVLLVGIHVLIRYSLAAPVLLLENALALDAIRRGIALMRGHRRRAFMIYLLTIVVTYAGAMLLQGPFLLAAGLIGIGPAPPAWLAAGLAVSGSLAQSLTLPFLMVSLVVLYFDIRVRKEALDLQLMMAPAEEPGLAAEVPLPPPPPTPGSLSL